MGEISFNNVTNSKTTIVNGVASTVTDTLNGTGHFDVLMKALRAHITEAVDSQEITQEIAGQVYTSVIPSLVAEAVKFELGADMVNVQIANELANTSAMLAETLAKLDKEMGYGSAKIADGVDDHYVLDDGTIVVYDKNTIILGDPDEKGLIDEQVNKLVEETRILINKT